MTTGYATPDGTRDFAAQFSDMAFNRLGATGLAVSPAGFGCYRVNSGVVAHAQALEHALTHGINVIDTSANYSDGGSEQMVGAALDTLIDAGRVTRDQVVVVSKGGYLQGGNYALSQQRKAEGRPFEDVVEYAPELEHCIHPEFLDHQIDRSLDRLHLDTLDVYLLHNPEYYLGWAHKQGVALDHAQQEYYRRLELAFRHLEKEVRRGRIRFYGISSNTFPATHDDPEFCSLQRTWEIAESINQEHHYKVVQLPLNLFEPGAVVEKNQPGGKTVLEVARDKQLGVLINRPLNAFTGSRMVRLSNINIGSRMDYKVIIDCIKTLAHSEACLWRKLLPGMEAIPGGIKVRIKQQVCFAETLKHHWRSFGSYERFREAKDGIFLPRIQGVVDFLGPHAEINPDLADWITSHEKTVDRALRAVASIYAGEAVALEKKIERMLAQADRFWGREGSLSQKAIRAIASTAGVSTVLVGMRRQRYVADVLNELHNTGRQANRTESWRQLRNGARDLFPD